MGILPEDIHRGLHPGRLQQMMQDRYVEEVERLNHCAKCGEPSLIACLSCEAVIPKERTRPSYCSVCGKPFPWTEKDLSTANTGNDEFGPLET